MFNQNQVNMIVVMHTCPPLKKFYEFAVLPQIKFLLKGLGKKFFLPLLTIKTFSDFIFPLACDLLQNSGIEHAVQAFAYDRCH
jgi:hypothetical protein